jgi:hypothetical protein
MDCVVWCWRFFGNNRGLSQKLPVACFLNVIFNFLHAASFALTNKYSVPKNLAFQKPRKKP